MYILELREKKNASKTKSHTGIMHVNLDITIVFPLSHHCSNYAFIESKKRKKEKKGKQEEKEKKRKKRKTK